MAASTSSRSRGFERNTEEDMDTQMETGPSVSTENDNVNNNNDDKTSNTQEPDDPFKKPALFAAPSLVVKRGAVASNTEKLTQELGTDSAKAQHKSGSSDTSDAHSSDPTAKSNETSASSLSSDQKTENADFRDKHSDKEKSSDVKPKQDLKPRFPKAPLAGKFKPHPPVPYTEPPWGGVAPDNSYSLEILKNGTIVDTVPLTQNSYFVVGRLPVCDISLEHPSISRYHAVIQFRGRSGDDDEVGEESGFYVHDLGSTHGTVVNKNKIPPKTYIRVRVGHVIKFGGSTRLFILQGPDFDEEAESELTVTELRERARKQRAELEKRMLGGDSDDSDEEKVAGEGSGDQFQGKRSGKDDSGCSWGMAEEAAPEEDESEENPFATEFQEDQEAAYLKDPKKALQGFYDREGEELEFEYEDKNHGTWLCRVRLPVDDAAGKQLVAEVTHTGKKKEAAILCSLEACRILEARGLLRQEAVSRKRKKKNWEDEDYYDSDDDTFLDRTGAVERKRQERMKKAGKVDERPDTYESLVAKLAKVEKELGDTQKKLNSAGRDSAQAPSEDPLDAFMSAVRSEEAMDGVERRRLHVHAADLRREAHRLRRLVELTRPAQMPTLQPGSGEGSSEPQKPKKSLPLFGAMKGGSKFKLKTGTIGKLPPKRPHLPAELFDMKGLPSGGEEEEEEEEEEEGEEKDHKEKGDTADDPSESPRPGGTTSPEGPAARRHGEDPAPPPPPRGRLPQRTDTEEAIEATDQADVQKVKKTQPSPELTEGGEGEAAAAKPRFKKGEKKKTVGPGRPPGTLSTQYPEDDPDYCVWMPPAGQSGDGRTHLNEKFGY